MAENSRLTGWSGKSRKFLKKIFVFSLAFLSGSVMVICSKGDKPLREATNHARISRKICPCFAPSLGISLAFAIHLARPFLNSKKNRANKIRKKSHPCEVGLDKLFSLPAQNLIDNQLRKRAEKPCTPIAIRFAIKHHLVKPRRFQNFASPIVV